MKIDRRLLLGASLLLSGCGMFAVKPSLPKQAETESPIDNTDKWALAVQRADIIYFPVEAIGSESIDQALAKIVEALQNGGTQFLIAWQGIEHDKSNPESPSDPRWTYSGRLRDHCRTVMRQTIDARHLFLGLPVGIREKLQRGSALDDNEKGLLPRGYRTPANGLEDFAEQLATVRGLQEREIENLYRAHLAAEQFAAEHIVTHLRGHEGEKLLVFARRRELGGELGLPAFVEQKLKLRQINFELEGSRKVQSRLVRSRRSGGGIGAFQVVDRAPGSGCDRLHRLFPWARACAVVSLFFAAPEEISGL
jgi:hypothetical protein